MILIIKLISIIALVPVSLIGMMWGWGIEPANWGWIAFSYAMIYLIPIISAISEYKSND